MTRKEILDTAAQYVCVDRDKQYGSPEDNFSTVAAFWSTYLSKTLHLQIGITAHDVGVMQALLKIARIAGGHIKDDNYVDLAGYAACAGELSVLLEATDDASV